VLSTGSIAVLPKLDENCMSEGGRGCVAILLSAFNGEKYIAEQLDSIIGQTHKNWILHVSDDGSVDGTCDIVRDYISLYGTGSIYLHEGPRKGFAQNFLSLVRRDDIVADYYVFCDQDDVWLPSKLERALDSCAKEDPSLPFLYCSRTRLVDEHGKPIGFSSLFSRPVGFGNALVQSLAGANTMLFNNATRDILRQVPLTANIVSHDWLAYMLVSGCGGKVFYDPQPFIDYRQHQANLVGANAGLFDRLRRFMRVLGGTFHYWNESNLVILQQFERNLTAENREVLSRFLAARRARGYKAASLLGRSGVYRQSRLEDWAMKMAAVIGKI